MEVSIDYIIHIEMVSLSAMAVRHSHRILSRFFRFISTFLRRAELKCHCDICKDDNYICETDGLCFTSVELKDNDLVYSYR